MAGRAEIPARLLQPKFVLTAVRVVTDGTHPRCGWTMLIAAGEEIVFLSLVTTVAQIPHRNRSGKLCRRGLGVMAGKTTPERRRSMDMLESGQPAVADMAGRILGRIWSQIVLLGLQDVTGSTLFCRFTRLMKRLRGKSTWNLILLCDRIKEKDLPLLLFDFLFPTPYFNLNRVKAELEA